MARLYLGLALALTAVAGCAPAGVPSFAANRLGDRLETTATVASQLAVNVEDRTASRGQKGYGLKYVRVLDWETASATLSNTNPAVLPAPIALTANASVAANLNRSATFSFSPLTPSGNYTLLVELKRKNAAGVVETLAQGTNAGFTVAPGANPITVNINLNPGTGELTVAVPQPNAGLNSVNTTPLTQSHVAAQRVAGSGGQGAAVGTDPLTATFSAINGVESDGAGAYYVADAGNQTIRKVTGAGSTVIAGTTGVAGFAGDGFAATTANLSTPVGLLVDPPSGAILFCDANNNRIRRIDPGGNIFTYAGGGADAGASPANALLAQLDKPWGICADQNSNVYFTEYGSGRVRRINGAGVVATLATYTPNATGAIAIDRTNKILWVTDGATVKRITACDGAAADGGTIYTAPAGSTPRALAFDQVSELYIAEGGAANANNALKRQVVTTTGQPSAGHGPETLAGTAAAVTALTGSVATVAVPNAVAQGFATDGWCGLYVDLWASNNPGLASGGLIFGNSLAGGFAQIVRFDPSPL